jgi:ankyrin repeat protein
MHAALLTVLFAAARAKVEACPQLAVTARMSEAIHAGDAAALKRALDDGARASCWLPGLGDTPLGHALLYGHAEIADMLLDAGADATLAASSGCVPLAWVFAPMEKKTGTIKRALMAKLLAKGAVVNVRCTGRPLVAAITAESSVEDLEILLSAKPDVNLADSQGVTPFEHAARGQIDADAVRRLDLLTAAGATPPLDPSKGEVLLRTAVERCARATFARLEKTGLHFSQGSSAAVTALGLASGCGDTVAANGARSAGALATMKPSGASSMAEAALTALIAFGKKADAVSASKLITALIAEGASVKTSDGRGRSPLMLAAQSGQSGLFELIASGAEPRWSDVDRDGHNVAWYAAAGGNAEILAETGKKVELAKAATPAMLPLQAAIDAGQIATIDWLLAHTTYASETLGAMASAALQRVPCTNQDSPVFAAVVRLVEKGAHPAAMRRALICHPQVDRLVAAAGERSRIRASDDAVPMQMVIWGKGERWAEAYDKLRPALEAWVEPAAGLPRRIDQELVVAVCPADEVAAALQTWKAFHPGIVARNVSLPARERACPWVLGGNAPARAAQSTKRADATLALAVFDSPTALRTATFTATSLGADGSIDGSASESFTVPCSGTFTAEVVLHPSPRVVLRCPSRPTGESDPVFVLDASVKPWHFRRP